MRISYNWLKDYLDVDLPVGDVAEILTNIGLEVEDVVTYGLPKNSEGVLIVGEVVAVEDHPNADKLKVAKVNVGSKNPLQIICGAPNVEKGQKVVVAKEGAELHPYEGEPLIIKKAKIRGVDSEGMICAEDEIGIGNNHEGIMVLPGDSKIGSPAINYLQSEQDSVFEIGLTPNRTDAMSHIGVACDLHAYLQVYSKKKYKFSLPDVSNFKEDNHDLNIPVQVKNREACPRYAGVTLQNVKVDESPGWLKNRLLHIGVRPLNSVVDVTNYVLWETGQPLHSFDVEEITGRRIEVKTLGEGTDLFRGHHLACVPVFHGAEGGFCHCRGRAGRKAGCDECGDAGDCCNNEHSTGTY